MIIANVPEMAGIVSQTDNVSDSSIEEISAGLEKQVERSEEQHAFNDSMKLCHSEGYISSSAARESVVELFQPDSLPHHYCLKSPLLYLNLRNILNLNGTIFAQRQGLAVYQAVSSAI